MIVYFNLNLYWLLLPLGVLLLWWAFRERADEHGGYLSGVGLLFRLPVAVFVFVLVLCALLAINLWLK